MTDFKCEVFEIDRIEEHSNADKLEIVYYGMYPCIVKKNKFSIGDKAVYIPVDSLVPLNDERFSFLRKKENQKRTKIKAIRLRGVYSQGLVIPWNGNENIGEDVSKELNIIKWEPEIEKESTYGNFDVNYNLFSHYDIENLRKYPYIFEEGEEVVITEKIHGANASFVFSSKYEKILVKSRKKYRKESEDDLWWKILKMYNLEKFLYDHPDIVVFGEIYGNVQDLKYDLNDKIDFRVFDFLNLQTRCFLDWNDYQKLLLELYDNYGIYGVPVLYSGPWKGFEKMKHLAEGNSTIANHIREGFVVKPKVERYDYKIGRVILKLHGECYLSE